MVRVNLVAAELACALSLAALLTVFQIGAGLSSSFLLSYVVVASLFVFRRMTHPVSLEVPRAYCLSSARRALIWAMVVTGLAGVGGFLFSRSSSGSAGPFILGLILLAVMLGSLEFITRIDRYRHSNDDGSAAEESRVVKS